MWKLTIYCCYHDKTQKKDDDKLTKWFYGPDWLLNPYLSEFSMFYDIRKNDKDSDYIGTCHYRRRIYSWDFDENLVNDNSCQVYEVRKWNRFSGAFWLEKFLSKYWRQCPLLWDDYVWYCHTIDKGEEYIDIDKKLWKQDHIMISKSSGIMSRHHFMNMCEFMFWFLDYIDKKYELNYDPKKYDDWLVNNYIRKIRWALPFNVHKSMTNMKRLFAYTFEWLYSIYVYTNIQSYNLIDKNNLIYSHPWTSGTIKHLFIKLLGLI